MPLSFGLYKSLPSYLKWALSILLLLCMQLIWSLSGRNKILNHSPLQIREISEVGEENYNANIVCIQPYMLSSDYASVEVFYNKIDGYFSEAKEEGLLHENTLVVFPEHIGTPLFFINEKSAVINATSYRKANLLAISSNLWQYFINALKLSDTQFLKVFLGYKANEVCKVYQFVFSSMAKKYKVHVLAGSILLPEPFVVDGRLKVNKNGGLQNTSIMYLPDGKAIQNLVTEKNINSLERTLIKESKSTNNNLFTTSFGEIAVSLGDDIWSAKPKNITINPYVTPSSLEIHSDEYFGNKVLEKINSNPNLTLESLFIERLDSQTIAGNTLAVSLFLRGKIWHHDLKGKTMISYKNEIISGFDVEGASIISIGIP